METVMKEWPRIDSPLSLVLLGCCALLAAPASHAALQKYGLRNTTYVNSNNVTPNPDQLPPTPGEGPGGRVLIGGSAPSPTLVKFLAVNPPGGGNTVIIPGLTTGLFITSATRDGPGVLQANAPVFTGTGSTAAGSALRWGSITGWTISGSQWCNSNPAIICSLAGRLDEVTVDPPFDSPFFDLGTWSFHGTGFTSVPYVSRYNTNDPGNTMFRRRGELLRDATVPAIPIVGIALIAGSALAAGALALRKR
jgi:hypothetical protein